MAGLKLGTMEGGGGLLPPFQCIPGGPLCLSTAAASMAIPFCSARDRGSIGCRSPLGFMLQDPNDADLASKIGQALVTTHDYNKAVVYYRNAVASDPNKTFLRHDLAHLYWRLGSYDKAEQTLKEAFNQRKQQVEDVAGTMDKVKSMLLLAKVWGVG